MLIYQLQNRVFNLLGPNKPKFPTDVEVKVKLGPGELFGTREGLIGVIIIGGNRRVVYNANTGRIGFENKPLKPMKASFELEEDTYEEGGVTYDLPIMRFDLEGDVLRVKTKCRDASEVNQLIYTAHYLIPSLLSVELWGPVFVKNTGGRIGDQDFRWELQMAHKSFQALDIDGPSEQAKQAFQRVSTLRRERNLRLNAALHYLHTARRLLAAGNSLWEFMAECVLNLCKVIEVFFGQDRNDIREELKKLGFSTQEIEKDYIQVIILRNQFDVGHVRLSIPGQDDLEALYNYLFDVDKRFCELVRRVIDKLDKGEYQLKDDEGLKSDNDDKKQWNRLIRQIRGGRPKIVRNHKSVGKK